MMEFQLERAYILEHFQEYRIIQPQVVFIHGLPSSLAHPQLLQRELSPLGLTRRINVQFISKDFYSAFIEFEHELSAALIIMMINEQSLFNRILRVFYGSTKFCPHYLKGHGCRLRECNYAHYYIPHLTHLRDKAKEIDHHFISQIYLCQNLQISAQEMIRLLTVYSHLGSILQVGRQRLSNFMVQQGLVVNPVGKAVEVVMEEPKKDKQWSALEKQISQEVSSDGEEKKKNIEQLNKRSKVQQFLDAAERFLTRLIFQSSEFVY